MIQTNSTMKSAISLKKKISNSLNNGFLENFFFAIVLGYIVFHSIETVPQFQQYTTTLKAINIAFNIIFLIEYGIRIIGAANKKKYIFSFWGIVDLLALLPSYILTSSFFNIKFIRLIRLLKILKNKHFYQTFIKLSQAFHQAKYELIVFVLLSNIFLYVSAMGIYFFEHTAQPDKFSSIPASFWWAIITLTTIGYGDVYPITAGGKIFTMIIIYIGLAFVAIPTSIITFHLAEVYKKK